MLLVNNNIRTTRHSILTRDFALALIDRTGSGYVLSCPKIKGLREHCEWRMIKNSTQILLMMKVLKLLQYHEIILLNER